VALGFLIPALGFVANFVGLGAVFLINGVLALFAAPIAAGLIDHFPSKTKR